MQTGKRLLTIVAAASLAAGISMSQMKSGADSTFVTKAAQGGMAEVEMGQLAVQHASNAKVKEFGQRMVDDHTKAGDELKKVATDKGMTVPSMVGAKEKATMARLSKLNGAAFDKAYMADMVKDHKEDVAEFQKETESGSDADVKAFATKTLPTLQDHLKMAQEIQSQLMKSGTE